MVSIWMVKVMLLVRVLRVEARCVELLDPASSTITAARLSMLLQPAQATTRTYREADSMLNLNAMLAGV